MTRLAESNRSCGSCTLCCTVMKVTLEAAPPKPAHTPCTHCSKKGCDIYADRPEACEGFQCLWLGSQRVPPLALPSSLRPDRCGVVLDLNGAGTIIAHCEKPSSWKRPSIHRWLLAMAARTVVMLELNGVSLLLKPTGATTPLVCIGVDPVTNNRVYAYENAS